MKTARKGSNGVKGLLLAHGEKVLIGVLGGVAAWVAYQGLSVQGESRTPAILTTQVTQVSSAIDSFSLDQAKEIEGEFVLAPEIEQVANSQVNPPDYVPGRRSLDPPIMPPTVERSAPKVLVATSLTGAGVTGLMPFVDPATLKRRQLEERRREMNRERETARNAEDNLAENNRGGRGGRGGEMGDPMLDDPEMKGMRPIEVTLPPTGVQTDGSELIRRVSCAVVLAKVPFQKQMEAYQATLENARGYNPSTDIPEYLGAYIERADVTAGDDAPLKWSPIAIPNVNPLTTRKPSPVISRPAIANLSYNWMAGPELLEDTAYDHPSLTFPLPPLVGRNWAISEVVHPDVPLAVETEKALNKAEELTPEVPAAEDGEEDLFGGAAAGGVGGPMGREGGEFGGRGMGGPMGGPMGSRGMGGPMGGEMGMGGRGGGMMGGGGGASSVPEYSMTTPFIMFRLFDYTVQPGRKYQYRVKLILNDVNRLQPLNLLDKDVRQRVQEYRKKLEAKMMAGARGPAGRGAAPMEMGAANMQNMPPLPVTSEWSEPSTTISIPLAGDVRVVNVSPVNEKQFNTEPGAKLIVQGFDVDADNRAMQAQRKADFRLGSVINLPKQKVEILVEQNRFLKKIEDFDLNTGVTLVDIQGGEKIAGELVFPGRVLLMDPAGRLYIRDQATDAADVEMYEMIYENKVKPGMEGMGPGMRGGPGGEFR